MKKMLLLLALAAMVPIFPVQLMAAEEDEKALNAESKVKYIN